MFRLAPLVFRALETRPLQTSSGDRTGRCSAGNFRLWCLGPGSVLSGAPQLRTAAAVQAHLVPLTRAPLTHMIDTPPGLFVSMSDVSFHQDGQIAILKGGDSVFWAVQDTGAFTQSQTVFVSHHRVIETASNKGKIHDLNFGRFFRYLYFIWELFFYTCTLHLHLSACACYCLHLEKINPVTFAFKMYKFCVDVFFFFLEGDSFRVKAALGSGFKMFSGRRKNKKGRK